MKEEQTTIVHAEPDVPNSAGVGGVLALIGQSVALLGGANAKEGAAAVETLTRLYREQEDRQARRDFFAALNEFHQKCPPIPKDHVAEQVSKRTGNSRNIPYAPLSTIERIVRPILIPLGFSWRWDTVPVSGGKALTITCYLMHAHGHQEHANMVVAVDENAPMNDTQALGSARTYGMRYSLEQVLGLVTTMDTDGNPPTDGEPLNEDQLADVELWLQKCPAGTREPFLKYMGAKSTAAIPKRDYQRAIAALKNKAASR